MIQEREALLAWRKRKEIITQTDGGNDVICHHTAIQADGFRTLAEGQKVEFDQARGPKGVQAQNVRPIA